MNSNAATYGFRILTLLLPVFFIFLFHSSKPVGSENRIATWGENLMEKRASYRSLRANGAPLEQMDAFVDQFRREYPLLTDWLMQDQEGEWEVFLQPDFGPSQDIALIEGVLRELDLMRLQTEDLWAELAYCRSQEEVVGGKQLLSLYVRSCERRRKGRLKNLLARETPIVFAQHANFKMSSIGYTEGLSDARKERFFKPGAKLSLLTFNGTKGEVEHLIEDAYGLIRDVDVSDDGRRLVFAWKKSDRLDDYHIYEYNLDTREVQQLTTGLGRADYEPVYLPDGDILFTSTRPEQSVPCWWTETSNLYRMNAEGQFLRRLAIDQVHTLYPQVMENGRVLYTRWEYNDRGQNFPHPLFEMNPDGTDQRVFYGGSSWFPNALLHARAIPGTEQVMAIVAGHHTRQHGKVVVLDVREGRDEGKGMQFVAPKREVPYERVDVAQQNGDQFQYPYPVNENEFIVSYLPEKPGAKYPQYGDDGIYGLYWMDLDGNRELLYSDGKLSVGRPVPLVKAIQPMVKPDTVDYAQSKGVYYVKDVYQGTGLKGIERGTAKKIRVVKLAFRAAGVGMSRNRGEGGGAINSTPVAIGNGSWDVKEILGEADIYEDGSALFEVPAMASIYLQVLDEKKRVIQTSRSWDTVRPGERKACQGCHVKEEANYYAFQEENTLAWKNGVQELTPFYGPSRGFSFVKEIQPILDQKCISCHNGEQSGVLSLRGELKARNTIEKRLWSDAYLNLTHANLIEDPRNQAAYYIGQSENKIVNWINKMSRPTELEPYSFGAAKSQLMDMLEAGHHGVALTAEEYHKLAAWLDLLVPFVGDYREANDWSSDELAYYNYYQYKREQHAEEELRNIREWMMAKNNGGKLQPWQIRKEDDELDTRYRILEGEFARTADNTWELNLGRTAMIDRIEMDFGMQQDGLSAPSSVIITLSDQSNLRKDFEPGSKRFVVSFGIPRNANGFRVDIKEKDQQYDLKGVKVWGRDMTELPYFESYHPYLKLGE